MKEDKDCTPRIGLFEVHPPLLSSVSPIYGISSATPEMKPSLIYKPPTRRPKQRKRDTFGVLCLNYYFLFFSHYSVLCGFNIATRFSWKEVDSRLHRYLRPVHVLTEDIAWLFTASGALVRLCFKFTSMSQKLPRKQWVWEAVKLHGRQIAETKWVPAFCFWGNCIIW